MKRMDARAGLRRLCGSARAHWRELAYYGCVALALAGIALAAEVYRSNRASKAQPQSLPAVEFADPAPEAEGAKGEEDAPRLPEGAEILRGYSEAPAWNPALGLWESHPALDLRLDEVCCLEAGSVRCVERGGPRGGCVELDCGGLLYRYASIEPREDLSVGDALAAGEAIGAPDSSMPGEAALGAHLHLELLEGDICVDPSTRLAAPGD